MKLSATLVSIVFVSMVVASSAFCATITGTVWDNYGRAVSGAKISILNSAGKSFGKATSNAQGEYSITGLHPATYQLVLDPRSADLKGGNAVAHLGSGGLIINWTVSKKGSALALAKKAGSDLLAQETAKPMTGDPFGFSLTEFTSLVALGGAGVGAGVLAGYGASGGFNSGNNPSPVSASQ